MPPAPTFAETVLGWHDFYLLAGTVAATLMGLLFVALSLHWDVVLEDSKTHLHAIAIEAFGAFLIVVFLSLLMLAPTASARPLGFSLMLLGGLRIVMGLRHSRVLWSSSDESFRRPEMIYRSIVIPAAFAVLAWCGYLIFRRDFDGGLPMLTLAVIALLGMGARASWDLLVRVGRLKMRAGQRPIS
jgi:hypothetical protein